MRRFLEKVKSPLSTNEVYLLSFNNRQADLVGNVNDVATTGTLRARFLQEHLGAWNGPLTAAVKANAETALYRHLAELTDDILIAELAPGSKN